MKKILMLLTFVLITVFPAVVEARVICNDGWVSSCIVSGPGCCSHHGGVSYSNNYNEDDDYEDYEDDDYEDYEDDDYEDYEDDDYESSSENSNVGIIIFIIIIIIFIFIIGACS